MDRQTANNLKFGVILFAAVFVAYWRALHGTLLWNDSDYVTTPELSSLRGLWLIWTKIGATEQYYPLLHSFFWLQHRLWGDSALGHHIVNVALHATAACLLAAVVRRLLAPDGRMAGWSDGRKTGGPEGRMIGKPVDRSADHPTIRSSAHLANSAGWLAAALFALHPVMVESVAWISEQKNTLSAVFYLWAALVYLRWDTKAFAAFATRSGSSHGDDAKALVASATPSGSSSGTRGAFRTYAFASALFLCALLSKSVTASLPAALLVALWWKRGRIGKRDVVPLIPWFVLGAGFGLFTAWVEHNFIGAKGTAFELTLLDRTVLAGRVIWFYLAKLIWPANLIFIYPRWQVSAANPSQWIYPIAAVALAAGLFAIRHRTRAPLAAYLFFVGTLFPTIGFFNVYAFQFSFVADHWVYLPAVGVFVLAAGLAARLMVGWSDGRTAGSPTIQSSDHPRVRPSGPPIIRPSVGWASAALLAILGVLAWRQTKGYSDQATFYREIISRNPGAWMAHNNLGILLIDSNRASEAIEEFKTALRLNPNFDEAENNYGVALMNLGKPEEGIVHLAKAVELKPTYGTAHYNYASALRDSGHIEDAINQFQEAARYQPDAAQTQKALAALGDVLIRAGHLNEAIEAFRDATRVEPGNALAHFNLGLALARSNRVGDALPEFQEAVRLSPTELNARRALVDALEETGHAQEAAAQAAELRRMQGATTPRQ